MTAQSPINNFKRSLGAATKAIAHEPDIDVSYGGDVAGLVQDQIMLPSLPPRPKPEMIAKARGQADALALKIALHDPALHNRAQPKASPARMVFEAMEHARIEALGAQHLSGLGDNLMAALDARASRRGFDKPEITKDDTSFAEAIGLYAREAFMGRTLPASTDGIMGVWRTDIDAKAAVRFASLKDLLADQEAFGQSVQQLIQDFELGQDLAQPEEDDNSED
ncbi:MAG: cobaltochelatase subunit CobT, partial [Litorimonas sp.]